MNINEIMTQLAQYTRMSEETTAIIEDLRGQLKDYMTENNLDTLVGDEHKATYKPVESSKIDTKALKAELPEIAARYTTTSSFMRFNFA